MTGRWVLPALALLLGACQGPIAPSGPVSGGTLTVSIQGDPATLNRFVAGDSVSRRVAAPLMPMLYSLNPDMSVSPDLAEGFPSISDGDKVWTVRLRHGAKWSDGQAITADDLVKTVEIQRAKGLQTDAIFDWDKLDKVEKKDDYTVRFTLTEPYAPFLANSLVTFVAPAHVYGLIDPQHMREDPIGTQPTVSGGPFKFDRRVAGQEVDLVANPDYYAGRPHLDRLVFKVIPSAESAANSLLDGEINWQTYAPYSEVKKLKGSATYSRVYPDMGYYDVRFNDRSDHPFGDTRVRQAFTYALDKEGLVRDATGGAGMPVWSDVLPTSWAYDPNGAVRYKQDLDRSRQLLKDAGWTPGSDGILVKNGKRFSVDFYVRKDTDVRVQAANQIAQKVRAVGMELKVTPVEYSVFFDPLKQGNFDVALSGFATGPDPDNYYIFHSSQIRPEHNPTGVNWTGYSNPGLDQLIEQERSTVSADPAVTRARRKPLFSQMEKLISGDVVTYFLWSDNIVQGFDTRLFGVPQGSQVNIDYGRNVRFYDDLYLKKS